MKLMHLYIPLCFVLIIRLEVLGLPIEVPAQESHEIFCAERNFPEEFNCDFDMLYTNRLYVERGLNELTSMYFEFPYKNSDEEKCVVFYLPGNAKSANRLFYAADKCKSTGRNVTDIIVPRSTTVTVLCKGDDDSCFFNYVYGGTIDGERFKDRNIGKLFKFNLKNYSCTKAKFGITYGSRYSKESIFDSRTNRERPVKSM